MAQVQAIVSKDMDVSLLNGQDYWSFYSTQDSTEEVTQTVNYRGGYGTEGATYVSRMAGEQGTLSFSAVLMRSNIGGMPFGPQGEKILNGQDILMNLKDFIAIVTAGPQIITYQDCNWTRLSRQGGGDQTTFQCDLAYPIIVDDQGNIKNPAVSQATSYPTWPANPPL